MNHRECDRLPFDKSAQAFVAGSATIPRAGVLADFLDGAQLAHFQHFKDSLLGDLQTMTDHPGRAGFPGG